MTLPFDSNEPFLIFINKIKDSIHLAEEAKSPYTTE